MHNSPVVVLALSLCVSSALVGAAGAAEVLLPSEEFVGPLPGWKNLQTDFGAKGDGKADDTPAFTKAFAAMPFYGKGADDDWRVLYLPAGIYRITAPLTLQTRISIAIMGEHPERTRVLYDGPPGEAILTCNGVSMSKFGRITWDGQGKARAAVAHQWDTKEAPAVTYMEHADEVFQDVGRGIIGGRVVPVVENGKIVWYGHGMDAETLVKRCKFIRCNEGLSIESFNALDWWVWDSEFIDCRVGATNCAKGEYGGGHFHIYRSVFRRSKEADIRIGHTSYFGFRLNTSIGSKRFLEAIRPTGYGEGNFGRWKPEETHGAMLSLLRNRIINPQDATPIRLDEHGPLIMLDNTFVVKPDGAKPLVQVTPPMTGAECISIGNRFFGASRIEVNGNLVEQDNAVAAYDKAGADDLAEPVLPPTAPLVERRIFALTQAATHVEIQQAIDEAAKLIGQKPVVYLQAGKYHVGKTLTIPPKADVQLIGDGFGSVLVWEGENNGTMLQLTGPTRVTLRDFEIVGIWNKSGAKLGRGIVVGGVDQKGGQILLDQVQVGNCIRQGMLFDGLEQTRVEAQGSGCGGTAQGAGLIVSGVGDASKTPWIGLFGSAGSNNRQTHLVRKGGNLMVWDTWYETSVNTPDAEPRYIHLTDRGNLTFFNGHVATLPGEKARRDLFAIDLDGFAGRVAIIGTGMDSMNPQVRLAGDGQAMKFLALGVVFDQAEPYFSNESKNAEAAMLACRRKTKTGYANLPTVGKPSEAFLREMLAPARTVLPTYWQPAPDGVTDLRMHRIMVQYEVGEGITVKAGAP